MKGYSSEDYEVLFTEQPSSSTEVRKGVSAMRAKTVRHGDMIDVMLYPIWATHAICDHARKAKAAATRTAQVELNHRRSQDRLVWLANANFQTGDGMLTCSAFKVPNDDPKLAQKKISAFLRRLKRYWARHGRELKYIYTTERTESKENGVRFHLHILLNFHGFDREELEKLWGVSMCNSIVMRENDEEFSGMARYMNIYKQHQTKATHRAWNCSRNLVQPKITVSDHKVSVRRAEQIARDMDAGAREIFEKVYPEYRLTRDVTVRSSEFVPGVYVYARMRRKEGAKR